MHSPPTRIAHYQIEGVLGQGGMGVVYLAEDLLLHRRVALKFLPPEVARDEEARRRFLNEGGAAAALSHPNAAVIYEVGSDGGSCSWPWNTCPVPRCPTSSPPGPSRGPR